MTKPRLHLGAIAAALLISGAWTTDCALAALRHDGIAPASAAAPEATLVRLDRRRHVRRHRHIDRFYGYEDAPALPTGPMPVRRTPAPSYCAGQFQDVSPNGLFRDNSGQIRPCF